MNERLARREPLRGTHIFAGMPILTEAVAQCGFDVLWIDMEHTGIGIDSLANNLIAARAGGTPAWVRIPWNDPVLAKPVLDMGADGIIFPYIRTVEDAERAAAACSYPPEGVRGYGPLRAADYGGISQMDYLKNHARDCRRIIQIEHIDAVRSLEKIAAVEGIDAYIVGQNDLSGSVGKIGEVRSGELRALYRGIAAVLGGLGKPFGVSLAWDEEAVAEWIGLGATVIFAGTDVGYVHDGAAALKKDFDRLYSNRRENV